MWLDLRLENLSGEMSLMESCCSATIDFRRLSVRRNYRYGYEVKLIFCDVFFRWGTDVIREHIYARQNPIAKNPYAFQCAGASSPLLRFAACPLESNVTE